MNWRKGATGPPLHESEVGLTASALSAIYKVYSYSSTNGNRNHADLSLPLNVDARVIQRCLHWMFVHQVSNLYTF